MHSQIHPHSSTEQQTSTQTQIDPTHPHNEFHTVNSIYQLQSIINKLSIEKEKYWINYTLAIKEQKEQAEKYESAIGDLRARIGELEVKGEGLGRELKVERERVEILKRDKEELDRVMDSVAGLPGERATVYSIIGDYGHMRNQLAEKVQQVNKLQQELRVCHTRIKELDTQNTAIRTNFTSQLQNLHLHLQLQQSTESHTFSLQQHRTQSQQQLHSLQSQLVTKQHQLLSAQQQNSLLLGRIQEYRHTLQHLKHVHTDNSLLRATATDVGIRRDAVGERYQELLGMHEGLQQENWRNVQDKNKAEKQRDQYRILCQSQTQQLASLHHQLTTTKQSLQKMTTVVTQFQLQSHKQQQQRQYKQPTDWLGKLQQLTYEYGQQRDKMHAQIGSLTRMKENYYQAVLEAKQEIGVLREEKKVVEGCLEKMESSRDHLSGEVSRLAKNNYELHHQINQLRQQLHQKQLDNLSQPLKQACLQTIPVPTQTYHQLLQQSHSLSTTNSTLLTHNTALQRELTTISHQLTGKTNQVGQLQYQVSKMRETIGGLEAEREGLRGKVARLQGRLVDIGRESQQGLARIRDKMGIMGDCVEGMRRDTVHYWRVVENSRNKKQRLQNRSKTIELKIQKPINQDKIKNKILQIAKLRQKILQPTQQKIQKIRPLGHKPSQPAINHQCNHNLDHQYNHKQNHEYNHHEYNHQYNHQCNHRHDHLDTLIRDLKQQHNKLLAKN